MKKVLLSVGEFALPVPRKGSIDIHSGFQRATALGQEVHKRVQEKRRKEYSSYEAEVAVSHELQHGGFIFQVSGRMDGLFSGTPAKIEEIKSTFSIRELSYILEKSPNEHPYCLQLKTYGYIHWLQKKDIPKLTFHLVSTRDWESIDLSIRFDPNEYEQWLALRLDELVQEAKLAEKRAARRRQVAQSLPFPFLQARSGQKELIETVADGMRSGQRMLIQAPTGLGKTVGVLYPALKEAMGRGQRVIYVTPKNSQHSVAEDAVEKLQDKGAKVKSLTITAKSKICLKNEPLCNSSYCEYAKDHYTKVNEHKLLEQLAKKKKLSARIFKTMAEKYEVCPFELQLDSALDVDTVICDYNYVFAPRSAFGRMTFSGLDQDGKPNLVIDEAHNLPSRAMDYYSPSLSSFTLEKMREDLRQLPPRFRTEAIDLLNASIDVLKNCQPEKSNGPLKIRPPSSLFLAQDGELRAFLSRYLESDIDIQPRDPVLRLCFYWSEFTEALQYVDDNKREEFFTTFTPHPTGGIVKITCCDASEALESCYNEYQQVVGFSATLKPFEFYSRLSGLESPALKTAEFLSPFPKSRRKLLIIPQISSKYSERSKNYPRIAETIRRISAVRPGNYFAFFPSFDFMERVYEQLSTPLGFRVLKQERFMKPDAIESLLEQLRSDETPTIIFAVQGGVLSEGVDYPGKMAIGAFIVGPPLPIFDLEREEMRAYYEKNYSAGFDYAYTYPAMAKAVQAAGRVIRSETDHGLIVLMDNRFIQSSYVKSMPQDWFVESPKELISNNILKEVAEFWNQNEITINE